MFSFNLSDPNTISALNNPKNQKILEDVSFKVVGKLTSLGSGIEYSFGLAHNDSSNNIYVWPTGMVELFFKVKDLPKLLEMTGDKSVKKFLSCMIKYGAKIEKRLIRDKAVDEVAESIIKVIELSQSLNDSKTEDGKNYIKGFMAEKIEACNKAIDKWNSCIPKPIKHITAEDIDNPEKLEEFVYDQFDV